MPSVTGSCSHPTGTGLGAVLFGPPVMSVIGAIVLLFQALLLAHGGITTLGANIFSMAIVGPWVSYGLWQLFRSLGLSMALGVFVGAALGDLATYVTTSVELAAGLSGRRERLCRRVPEVHAASLRSRKYRSRSRKACSRLSS